MKDTENKSLVKQDLKMTGDKFAENRLKYYNSARINGNTPLAELLRK